MQSPSAIITPSPITNQLLKPGDTIKFLGTITEFDNGCWADGLCSVKIDDKWIEAERGGLQPPDYQEEPRGQLIGISFSKDNNQYVGKKVEVYGKVIKENYFTIYGDQSYYIKLFLEEN